MRRARPAGRHARTTPSRRRAGCCEHFRRVADATDVPIMLYDIPGRSGVAIATDTLLRLAEHPRIVAVKDAKGDLAASADVMSRTDLAYYSGDDAMTLPLLSIGAVGVVGTSTHFSGLGTKQLIEAFAGRRRRDRAAAASSAAADLHRHLRHPGLILVKAGLGLQGRGVGGVRSPLVVATEAEIEALRWLARRRRSAGGCPAIR